LDRLLAMGLAPLLERIDRLLLLFGRQEPARNRGQLGQPGRVAGRTAGEKHSGQQQAHPREVSAEQSAGQPRRTMRDARVTTPHCFQSGPALEVTRFRSNCWAAGTRPLATLSLVTINCDDSDTLGPGVS